MNLHAPKTITSSPFPAMSMQSLPWPAPRAIQRRTFCCTSEIHKLLMPALLDSDSRTRGRCHETSHTDSDPALRRHRRRRLLLSTFCQKAGARQPAHALRQRRSTREPELVDGLRLFDKTWIEVD